MKRALICLLILFTSSCIPLKNAPNIHDYDIVVAKKFKRDLPKRNAFVFEDKNNTDTFYQFVLWKLGRIDVDLQENIPFEVGDATYYMTFYERPRESASLNLIPLLINGEAGGDELYDSDGEYWYILITVTDSELRDCLDPSYPDQKRVVYVLKQLKDEYQNSEHNNESSPVRELPD